MNESGSVMRKEKKQMSVAFVCKFSIEQDILQFKVASSYIRPLYDFITWFVRVYHVRIASGC